MSPRPTPYASDPEFGALVRDTLREHRRADCAKEKLALAQTIVALRLSMRDLQRAIIDARHNTND